MQNRASLARALGAGGERCAAERDSAGSHRCDKRGGMGRIPHPATVAGYVYAERLYPVADIARDISSAHRQLRDRVLSDSCNTYRVWGKVCRKNPVGDFSRPRIHNSFCSLYACTYNL